MNNVIAPRERTPEPRSNSDSKPIESKATTALTYLCLGAFISDVLAHGEALSRGKFYLPRIYEGEIHRIATSQILHVDLMHLLANMYSLSSVGPAVEARWGASSFLKIGALTGIAKIVAHSTLDPNSRSVGASALLYGMKGALHSAEIKDKGISKTFISKIFFDLAKQTAGELAIEAFTRQPINYLGHLSGYIAGFAFGLFSTLNKKNVH